VYTAQAGFSLARYMAVDSVRLLTILPFQSAMSLATEDSQQNTLKIHFCRLNKLSRLGQMALNPVRACYSLWLAFIAYQIF
jgi:hypothetical protein